MRRPGALWPDVERLQGLFRREVETEGTPPRRGPSTPGLAGVLRGEANAHCCGAGVACVVLHHHGDPGPDPAVTMEALADRAELLARDPKRELGACVGLERRGL